MGLFDSLNSSILNIFSIAANTICGDDMNNFDNKSDVTNSDIPMGLGMAFMKNPEAMHYFSNLPDAEKQRIIDGTHQIESKEEMQEYVNHLVKQGV